MKNATKIIALILTLVILIQITPPKSSAIVVVDDAVIVVYATGLMAITTYAWVKSPQGQVAMKNGATAIYQGSIIAGKATSQVAKLVVNIVVSTAKELGKWITDIKKNPKNWVLVKSTTAPSKSYPGGRSIEKQWRHRYLGINIWEHILTDARGQNVKGHPHYRAWPNPLDN